MPERNRQPGIPWVAIAFVLGLGLLVLGAVNSSSLADPLGMLAMLGLALIVWSIHRTGKGSED